MPAGGAPPAGGARPAGNDQSADHRADRWAEDRDEDRAEEDFGHSGSYDDREDPDYGGDDLLAVSRPGSRNGREARNGDMRRAAPVGRARRLRRAKSRQRALVEWVLAVGLAVLAAFLIKTWLVQAFVIPSGSMRPTLEIDDRVLVSKFAYRISDVERGDVIVFDNPARLPGEPAQLIKRVVATEGDEVASVDGRLVVNDQPMAEPYLRPGTTTRGPDGGDLAPQTVPEDHLFVMGDNRGDSRDSRYLGPVPESQVVGKAFFRLWPLDRLGRL